MIDVKLNKQREYNDRCYIKHRDGHIMMDVIFNIKIKNYIHNIEHIGSDIICHIEHKAGHLIYIFY